MWVVCLVIFGMIKINNKLMINNINSIFINVNVWVFLRNLNIY